jgi:hypothetical protein
VLPKVQYDFKNMPARAFCLYRSFLALQRGNGNRFALLASRAFNMRSAVFRDEIFDRGHDTPFAERELSNLIFSHTPLVFSTW